jgi:hypothetical protein
MLGFLSWFTVNTRFPLNRDNIELGRVNIII